VLFRSNPVVMLPGALKERGPDIAAEFSTSCLMAAGQFCTNPGLVVVVDTPETNKFLADVTKQFSESPAGTLLSSGVAGSLSKGIDHLVDSGAEILVRACANPDREGYCHPNTLLSVSGDMFLQHAQALQEEAFGNVSMVVVARSVEQVAEIVAKLEGNLTGCIYSDSSGADDQAYDLIEPTLRMKVGRLLNDKMPTGVAVSPAMNHGGPFPATGHPGFTAVGIPASLHRFAMLQCYDNVRPARLPKVLRDKNATGKTWRYIDGEWTQSDVG